MRKGAPDGSIKSWDLWKVAQNPPCATLALFSLHVPQNRTMMRTLSECPASAVEEACADAAPPLSPTTGAIVAVALKDFAPPHACRAFTGYMREEGRASDPQGCVLR